MEQEAFEQVARQLRQHVVEVSRKFGSDGAEAEDIAQEVMIKLWSMRGELEKYHSLNALATKMTRYQFLNERRRRHIMSVDIDRLPVVDEGTTIHEKMEIDENERWFQARLNELPTTQHTILYMRQVERRTVKEISDILGLKEASVTVMLSRARRALLEKFKKRISIQ